MPASLNSNHATTWLESSVEIGLVPIPSLFPDELRICVLTSTDRVVNNHQIRTAPSNSPANTGSKILASRSSFPAPRSLAMTGKGNPQNEIVLVYQVADLTAPVLGQFGGMAGCD